MISEACLDADSVKEYIARVLIFSFSKKQMTFFRRMEKRGINIQWINPNSSDDITALVSDYIS